MSLFRPIYRHASGPIRRMSKFYVEFRDHLGTIRRLPAFDDKTLSREFERKILRLVDSKKSGLPPDADLCRWVEGLPEATVERLVNVGFLDPIRVAAAKPLADHLKDFQAHLRAKGNTEPYVSKTLTRVKAVLDGSGFKSWQDIQAGNVERFLADLRTGKRNISIQTSNYYAQAAKQFCKWAVREQRLATSPLEHLRFLNARTDRRRIRRALTVEEQRRLLAVTESGTVRFRMTGRERALVYELALTSGLRSSELKSLSRASFDFDATPPTVTVQAAYSKNRKEAVLPLRPETADRLNGYLASKLPKALAFPMPSVSNVSRMFRQDLVAAKIPFKTDQGVADFHGLRHSFISNLVASGVHPKTAQILARHSTITLTLDRYSHVLLDDQIRALSALPDLSRRTPGDAPAKAAGGETATPGLPNESR